MLLALVDTGTEGLFVVGVAYVGVAYVTFAAIVNVVVLRARLTAGPPSASHRRFQLLRRHTSFALGMHAATVIAVVPAFTLPAVVAGLQGASAAAYIAIPLQIASLLTLVPLLTGQSLLAELS